MALPAKHLNWDEKKEDPIKNLTVRLWIESTETGNNEFQKQMEIPLSLSPNLLEHTRTIESLSLHFQGPNTALQIQVAPEPRPYFLSFLMMTKSAGFPR